MKSKAQMWGNSLAVRIPKSMAEDAGVSDNGDIELLAVKDGIMIRPARSKPRLSELISLITPENLHGEWDSGEPVGFEVID